MLSGLRATVIMKEGSTLDQAKVEAAVKGKGMKFISMEKADVVRPQVAYQLVVEGAT